MAIIGAFIAANAVALSVAAASAAVAATTTAISVNQQNAQIKYQQEVTKQNAIAAQNKAAADMKTRRTEAARAQASTRAAMASKGIDSTSGSFLDLVGQGAAAGELDVLKAKHAGDSEAWTLNQQINELQTQKKNAWLEASLAGGEAGIKSLASSGLNLPSKSNNTVKSIGKTSGGSGIVGMDAVEGTVA